MESYETPPATVLVIDDNPTNLNVLSDYLADAGFTVLLKRDAQKALKLLERKIPDIILLDIVMPGMDGFATCQYLKSQSATQDIPVIFMTALSDTHDLLKGFELGAVDYITKPFQHEEVLARVKAHVIIQRLRTDLQKKNTELHAALNREKKLIEDLRLNLSISLPHELRTPLTAILGYAGYLHEKKSALGASTVKHMGEQIYDNALRLHHLVENALLYANLKLLKYNTNERQPWKEHSTVAVRPFLHALARQKARHAGREADLVLELTDIHVHVSPVNFEKILSELIDNAFKFSSAGTPVQITNTRNGNLCLITITDHGRGMSREQIDKIGAYMQFNRDTHEQQGAGLGLIVSQLLTQLEGGMFSLESESGQGISVSLVFNRAAASHPLDNPERSYWFTSSPSALWDNLPLSQEATAILAQCAGTLVLINDVWENCSLLDYLFTNSRCNLINAFDEIDGISKIMEYKPNFAFIDGGMLENEGITILKHIRQVAPEMKICVFAADTDLTREVAELQPFCDRWISTPIPLEHVLTLLLPPAGRQVAIPEPSQMAYPPVDDIARLYQLISHGDIKNFRRHLDSIEQANTHYSTFVHTLRELGRTFQLQRIREFLETIVH